MTIKPLKQYNESDVINIFAYDGASASKGLLVKVNGNGWVSTDEPVDMHGPAGASFANTISARYGTKARVTASASGEQPIGVLLMDVKETDENGEKLVFKPGKAAEMGVVVSGQTVPVLSRGVILYSGATLAAESVTAGAALYGADNGEITSVAGGSKIAIGQALGAKDSNNYVLIKLEL
jgi:hypothetical protein